MKKLNPEAVLQQETHTNTYNETRIIQNDTDTRIVKSERRHVDNMNDMGELVMSDGSVIGHRSLKTYYKQNVKPRPSQPSAIVKQMLSTYRSLKLPGYQGQTSEQTKSIQSVLQKKENASWSQS